MDKKIIWSALKRARVNISNWRILYPESADAVDETALFMIDRALEELEKRILVTVEGGVASCDSDLVEIRDYDTEGGEYEIILAEGYWVCNCADENPPVHPDSEPKCPKCGAVGDGQPRATAAQVIAAGLPLGETYTVE